MPVPMVPRPTTAMVCRSGRSITGLQGCDD
jgi:hypothetical protein